MTTFSQLVDDMILETRRPDLATEIRSYVNQTIRELHFAPDRGNVILYRENLRELSLVASVESGFTWEVPNWDRWQTMAAVRLDNCFDSDGFPVYASERTPGRTLNQQTEFYYRAGNYFAFSGYGGLNAVIALAYFEYPRRLKYFDALTRPASYDPEAGWTYAADIITDEQKLEAQEQTTNWILFRWADVLTEGIRAKVYKRASDDSRARTSYSLYSQLRQGLYTSEVATQDGVY